MKKLFPIAAVAFALAFAAPSRAAQPGQATNAYHSYLRALLLESQGNFVAAREEIKKALEQAPDSAYLYHTAAELSLRQGQVNQAADEIEKANDLDPTDVKSLILAGQINWALGNTEKAEAKLKRAVALAPDEAEAIVSLAGTLTPRDPQQAIKIYQDFLQRHPRDTEIWERLAQLYQATGDNAKAMESWQKTLDWDPSSIRAHLALAQIAEVNHDTSTAISHYEAVMADDPQNLPLLLRIGELRYRNNEMSKAYEAFSRAKSIAPNSAAANFWMALLAEQRGDWNEAISLLEKVSAEGPDPGVLLRLSYYYSQVGRFKDAVKVLEKLVQVQPNNTDFLNYLAIAYEQNDQSAKAEQALQKALKLDPSNHETHFQLATLYDRAHKYQLAEKELKTAIQLDPNYHVALNYLGYTYADRNENLKEAEDLLQKAVGLDPDNAAYMDSLGWLYYRKGEYKKASDFLTEATKRAHDPLIWEHLADTKAAAGAPAEAAIAYDQSLRLDPKDKQVQKKLEKLMKKFSPSDKVNFFMKRAIGRFQDVAAVNSLVEVRVCDGRPCFESKARLGYMRNEELRVEIPGPLSGPVMLLEKKKGKPAKYGAIHPEFQS
ncbi:MAG: tetratricopeptide repeat protein, partial [Elusimicrobia bacterium]|nr:tetratricopeptide repeat protein [Elusimicrobiota bacterium]